MKKLVPRARQAGRAVVLFMLDLADSRGLRSLAGTLTLFVLSVVAVVQFLRPGASLTAVPLANLSAAVGSGGVPAASASAEAFGRSGNVKLRFALPGDTLQFPLSLGADAGELRYQWVTLADSTAGEPSRPLTTAPTVAPSRPGFYHLAVLRNGAREILAEPTLAVIVPFEQKQGGRVNGYRIGTYLAERIGGARKERPEGFVEVTPQLLDLQITKHLKLADFVTHDDQGDVWPKYVALNPRLLDKLELVFADLGKSLRPELAVDVHSGFRSPSHNARVQRSARDSRHQYGDAADVAIDADGDGKITLTDELLIQLAVERVEDAHPDLVGGLGLYMSRRYRTPYVHIDARGRKSRWHG